MGLSLYSCAAAADANANASVSRATQELQAYIPAAMNAWGTPGLAIAVVANGHPILLKGYGVRDLRTGDRADPDTIFAIASMTKSFTAAMAAMAVDAGQVRLDQPYHELRPDVLLPTPELTSSVTLRDLLAHRSCIEDRNLLTWNTPFTRTEVLGRLKYLRQACPYRSRVEYNNQLYLLAGAVLERATGIAWDEFVQDRIFAPLGMARSTTGVRALRGLGNVATPYLWVGGVPTAVPLFDEDNEAPAGAIHSTARDLSRWLEIQLGEGTAGTVTLWSRAQSLEMHSPQALIRRDDEHVLLWPGSQFMTYGLGWDVRDYGGERLVEHGGQSDGMHSLISMLPARGIGLVVLTNSSRIGLPQALAHRFYDAVLGHQPRDWAAEFLKQLAPLNASIDPTQRLASLPHVSGKNPSHDTAAYSGDYHNAMLGNAVVQVSGGGLTVSLLGRRGTLSPWHYETFHADWGDDLYLSLESPLVTFHSNAEGNIVALELLPGDRFERTTSHASDGQ